MNEAVDYGLKIEINKNTPLKINKSSLRRAQKRLDKLRSVKDAIYENVNKVPGISGILLHKKVHIFTATAYAKKMIEQSIDAQYTDSVSVEMLTRQTKGSVKKHIKS